MQSFAREKELCKFLKDLEHANRCLRSHKPIPSACSDHTSHSLDVLLPLISQQAVLLEQAATAGVGGASKHNCFASQWHSCSSHKHRTVVDQVPKTCTPLFASVLAPMLASSSTSAILHPDIVQEK